ncbi:MAG: helix-turn-helix domain-containing protein [Treponema sp.]|nr:helix-turn-helix domain-containing protein [Treponema sp.]
MDDETINERIKKVRLHLQLPQAKFCKAIFLSNGHYAELEIGKRKVNSRIIKLIATIYHVNETYLQTGEGVMFDEELDLRLDRMITLFQEFSPAYKDYILQQIELLKKLRRKTDE